MAAHASGNQCAAVLNKSQCIYTKCYCEENVYWLVHKLAGLPIPASVKALLQQQQCATVKHSSPASADDAAPPATASASRAAGTATGAQAPSPSSPSTRTPAAELCSISRPPADPVAELSCLWVVFVSNPAKQVPLWCQGSGSRSNDGLVVWDYHVILTQTPGNQAVGTSVDKPTLVWDLDTTLPFPCEFKRYALHALKHGMYELAARYRRRYRVVPARDYVSHFASDRSHMLKGGEWLAAPPSYPCIVAQQGGCTNNINRYWDMALPDDALVESSSSCDTEGESDTEASGADGGDLQEGSGSASGGVGKAGGSSGEGCLSELQSDGRKSATVPPAPDPSSLQAAEGLQQCLGGQDDAVQGQGLGDVLLEEEFVNKFGGGHFALLGSAQK